MPGEVSVECSPSTATYCPPPLFSDTSFFSSSSLSGSLGGGDYSVQEACADLLVNLGAAARRSEARAATPPPPPPAGDLPELTENTGGVDPLLSSVATSLALTRVTELASLGAQWVMLRPVANGPHSNSLWIAIAVALRHGTSPAALTFTNCDGSAQVSVLGVGVKYANASSTEAKAFEAFLNNPADFLWDESTNTYTSMPTWMTDPTLLQAKGITIPSRVIYRQGAMRWWDSANPSVGLPKVKLTGSSSGDAMVSTSCTAPWNIVDGSGFIDPCGAALANEPDIANDPTADTESCPDNGFGKGGGTLSFEALDNAAGWAVEQLDTGSITLGG